MYIDWRILGTYGRAGWDLLPNAMQFDTMRDLMLTKILMGCRSHEALVEKLEELLD